VERWKGPRPGRVALVSGMCGAGIALCCLVAANRDTAKVAGSPAQAAASGVDLPHVALRMALALGLMIVLILAAAAALRFFGRGAGLRGSSRLQVLDSLPLAPKRVLYSVQAGRRVVVLGVTEASITLVLELPPEEAAALYPDGAAVLGGPSFRELLRGARTRLGAA
jgi:flagellar biogenesis protein FliO